MEGPDQATLKELWTSGRRGTLCPKEMMKAWGIAWCMKNHFKKEVNYEAIAGAVVKIGGGQPCRDSIRELCNRIDDDRRHNVAGLCGGWRKRLRAVVDKAGDVTGN